MSLISVIVPVYKVEKYLKRCIESILNQTFTDFDLILVDDGSPDNCPIICDYYKKKDNRVHVIHQKNGGLSVARNSGIKWSFNHSNSEWVTFVDSDDWIHSKFLEIMYQSTKKTNASISICDYISTSGEEKIEISDKINYIEMNPEDFYSSDAKNVIIAWGKLYKKECFKNLLFPVGKIHEDEFVTYRILFEYPKLVVVNAPLYAYFNNNESIMNSKWNLKNLSIIDACEEQIKYFNENGYKKAHDKAIRKYIWYLSEQVKKSKNNNEVKLSKSLKKKLKKILHKYKKKLDIKINNYSWAYESCYPNFMKIYWLLRALKNRIIKYRE